MTTLASQIGWAGYQNYEGPWWRGSIKYQLPDSPDFLDKSIQVVTTTEGGTYDAINMYDSCILSVGIIQLCARLGELTAMYSACAAYDLGTMRTLFQQLPTPADFRQTAQGPWNLFLLNGQGFADNEIKLRNLFLCGATGIKGQWSDMQKSQARQVAAVMSNLWESSSMQLGQVSFIKPKLMSYVLPRAKSTLFTDPVQDGYQGALKAAFISYAVNIPVEADKLLAAATQEPSWSTASDQDKFALALKHMVFDSQISIWPTRYRAIQPVLETLFGVTIPTLEELHSANPFADPNATNTSDENLMTVIGIQTFLIAHGYEVGPDGADGIWGSSSAAAVKAFQLDHSLKVDGVVGPLTRAAMMQMQAQTP